MKGKFRNPKIQSSFFSESKVCAYKIRMFAVLYFSILNPQKIFLFSKKQLNSGTAQNVAQCLF